MVIENDKIIDYMFERLQECLENNDEEGCLEIERKLGEFGFTDAAKEVMEIIKTNFKDNE